MEDMDIILSLEEYSIYKNNYYYLCVPNNEHKFYHVFLGFSLRNLEELSYEKIIIEIRKISDSVYASYKNSIYVLPIINPALLEEVALENDDRGYNKILKKYIQPITFSVYNKLLQKNYRVSQIIKLIKQNDVDKKIVGWLSMKLGDNFVKEILFEDNDVFTTIPIEVVNSSTIEDISVDYHNDDIWIKNEEKKISNSLKPAFSPGFSNLSFIILVLTISVGFGIILGYLILK